ncbi:MAG TPA: hypothetical protein VKT73_12005 [Xanthobacteraceae bacterium]|nr:hypothetical protein [Xanthobacteraceae bacterium]
MRGRTIRSTLLAALVLAGAAYAGEGSAQGLLQMPPVGIGARPAMPHVNGTITTPTTPTVPRGRTPGKSTIIIPGVSASGTPGTINPGSLHPCGNGSGAIGSIGGNAGIATAPLSNPNNAALGVPNIGARNAPDTGVAPTTNPSVRPGVPSSC